MWNFLFAHTLLTKTHHHCSLSQMMINLSIFFNPKRSKLYQDLHRIRVPHYIWIFHLENSHHGFSDHRNLSESHHSLFDLYLEFILHVQILRVIMYYFFPLIFFSHFFPSSIQLALVSSDGLVDVCVRVFCFLTRASFCFLHTCMRITAFFSRPYMTFSFNNNQYRFSRNAHLLILKFLTTVIYFKEINIRQITLDSYKNQAKVSYQCWEGFLFVCCLH